MSRSAAQVALNIPEIARDIIDYLTKDWQNCEVKRRRSIPPIGPYATLNRTWQDIIESLIFANLRIELKTMPKVEAIMTHRRRGYVRNIQLDVRLKKPATLYDDETEEEALRNDRDMQATFKAFVECLSKWEKHQVFRKGIKLSIKMVTRLKLDRIDWESIHGMRVKWALRHGVWYLNSILDLEDPASLQALDPVKVISEVEMEVNDTDRRVTGRAICGLLAKIPSAKKINLRWGDAHWDLEAREEFAEGLSYLEQPMDSLTILGHLYLPRKLKSFDLSKASESGGDRLSQVLCGLGQRLEEANFNGMLVSDEIFSLQAPSSGLEFAPWARMRMLRLSYLPFTPSGGPLFVPAPGEILTEPEDDIDLSDEVSTGSRDSREFQYTVGSLATPALQNFYLAAGRAAAEMPVLEEMTLEALLGVNSNARHDFRYEVYRSIGTAVWTSNLTFSPEQKMLNQWRQVPRKNLNSELEYELRILGA